MKNCHIFTKEHIKNFAVTEMGETQRSCRCNNVHSRSNAIIEILSEGG